MVKKDEKKFEEALEELENIVKKLESGNVALDDAIENFTTAMKLAKTCDEKLTNAEENVNKILKENGELEDFKIEN